jgi:protein TonB
MVAGRPESRALAAATGRGAPRTTSADPARGRGRTRADAGANAAAAPVPLPPTAAPADTRPVGVLGMLAPSVRLPAGDLLPEPRRPVASAREFATTGLAAAASAAVPSTGAPLAGDAPRTAVTARPVLVSGGAPAYPTILLAGHVEGEVVARFVIDTEGRVDPRSYTVLRSTHPLFDRAVREALARARYRPAESDGRAVRQAIEQTFRFSPTR